FDMPRPGATYTAANLNQKVFFHRLESEQADDALVLARPDHPDWRFETHVSDDGRYIVVEVRNSTARRNRIFYKSVHAGEFVALIDNFDAGFEFVGNDGTRFYFWTNHSAPRGRLVAIDLTQPDPSSWQSVIAEGEDALESVRLIGDTLVALYVRDGQHELKLFERSGACLQGPALPTPGSILSIDGERDDREMFYIFHSFVYPPTVFRYDFAERTNTLIAQPRLAFDFERYEIRQEFAISKDGTRV